MKDLLVVVLVVIVLCGTWFAAIIETTPGRAETGAAIEAEAEQVQIIFGFNLNKFADDYPGADFGVFWDLATPRGITFYGADAFLGPHMTGSGLDFSHCDERVPKYLEMLPAGMNPILPVSSWNLDRLGDVYAHWEAAGWFDRREGEEWILFCAEQSDEVRWWGSVETHNAWYREIKRNYPELRVMVIDSRIPCLPYHVGNKGGLLEADVVIEEAHHHQMVLCRLAIGMAPVQGVSGEWVGDLLDGWYSETEFGWYVGGSFEETTQPYFPFKPAYYEKVMLELYGVSDADIVNVYTPDNHPELILGQCRDAGASAWLHWNGNEWVAEGASGKPYVRMELLMLLSGRE